MKIDEAIKILDNFEDPYRLYSVTERKVAARLGIEAMQWVKRYRPHTKTDNWSLLPGETED